jgi:RimJ/RimL family protein N-acetyltransferase
MFIYERLFTGRSAMDRTPVSLPPHAGFSMKVVFSNREADELEEEGFVFRADLPHAKSRLDAGAIAFCVFHAFELVNCGWVALHERAQASLPEPHIKVHFARNESFTGGTLTNPKFRGMGLMTCNLQERCRFLKDLGIERDRAAALKGNVASRKAALRAGYEIRGQVGFKYRPGGRIWREWPSP